MIDLVKSLLANQFEASLCTLAHAIEGCPDTEWNVPVARFPFCQVAFHALFFADYYLGTTPESMQSQKFHRAHPDLFGDYEQLEPREPTSLYTRAQIQLYLDFCRDKAVSAIALETEPSLRGASRFPRKEFSRAELHVYNIRHIQHHAAQLILRLRLDTDVDIPWIRSGWHDPPRTNDGQASPAS